MSATGRFRTLRCREAERGKAVGEGRLGDNRRLDVTVHHQPLGVEQGAAPRAAAAINGIAGDREAQPFERVRSEEHTSELQSLMRISYAVFCLKKKNRISNTQHSINV